MPTFFDALPGYFGSKRSLGRLIFALLASHFPRIDWRKLTFIDAFLGAGSISLLAKFHGFTVTCNDIAYRSALIGHALIANSSVTLTDVDVALLFREPGEVYQHVAEERFSPSVFALEHARFLDRGLHWARSGAYPGAKRYLTELLLMRWALRCQPDEPTQGHGRPGRCRGGL